MTREEVFRRIGAVEHEYQAAQLAITRLREDAAEDPLILVSAKLAPHTLATCDANMARTYAIRLYAEFEAALREYWTSARGMRRRTEPLASVLMDSIVARRRVDAETVQDAHAVREYRNGLLHGAAPARMLPLPRCRSFLYRFVSYLPLEW